MNTWPHVVQRALPPSPESRQALSDFVTRVRVRAAGEKAAGSNDVAVDLTLFQDLATALLAGADATPAAPGTQTADSRTASPMTRAPLSNTVWRTTGVRLVARSLPVFSARLAPAGTAFVEGL